jgi:hypothetical protein
MITHPTYFPSIESIKLMIHANDLMFEIQDHFKKQTYRTRCNIYSANGLLSMNIPIKHQKLEHQYTKDVKVENDFQWQKNHLKTLQNAYRSSPFFEYYEDEIVKIYSEKQTFLIDFIFKTIDLSFNLLQKNINYSKSKEYFPLNHYEDDFRNLVEAKIPRYTELKSYHQVFSQKYGFIPNLSILDLLFNEGPNSYEFLI